MEARHQVIQLAEMLYPELKDHRRSLGRQMNDDLHQLYLDRLRARQQGPEIPFVTVPGVPEEAPKDIANRIADNAPAIDDQNWSAIRRGITKAQEQGVWDGDTEARLTARLNDPFDGAINEHRVQKSRITAFFDRLL